MKRILATGLTLFSLVVCYSQTTNDFNEFRQGILNGYTKERNAIQNDFHSFRNSINADYAAFLRNAWSNMTSFAPIPSPQDKKPVSPVVFEDNQITVPVVIESKPIVVPKPKPSPNPISPIEQNEVQTKTQNVKFYGLDVLVRVPNIPTLSILANENDIASKWNDLSDGRFDNALYDLLEVRQSKQLCDWAYLKLVEKFSKDYFSNNNAASLMTAWLLCQSGYQIRIARDDNSIVVLFASNHTIFDNTYFIIDGVKYYPLENRTSNLKICNAKFKGEEPLSLAIIKEQRLGTFLSEKRLIKSSRYPNLSVSVAVNKNLIDFYNNYPTSALGSNPLSRWEIYASAPFATESASILYSQLKSSLSNCTKIEAVEQLLNWVQTGFQYAYDDIVWGHDRAFFAEETLYYPYCDCEDRSILFSHLVREICGLDVALVYYPNHLAAAVKFKEPVPGDAVNINGEKFVICDPTYIGAKIGHQMPGLDYSQVRTLVLNALK